MVRKVSVFAPVCRNPTKGRQDLDSYLRSCIHEAGHQNFRDFLEDRKTSMVEGTIQLLASTAEDSFEFFLIGRQLRGYEQTGNGGTHRKSRGYGNPASLLHKSNNRLWAHFKKVQWDVCIICSRKGCHFSKHR